MAEMAEMISKRLDLGLSLDEQEIIVELLKIQELHSGSTPLHHA